MCGIVGIINFSGQPVDPVSLIRMRDRMSHRGPDDCGGVLLSPDTRDSVQFRTREDISAADLGCFSVGLAHRRLSILDLSAAGRQPMCNEDGSIWITFNGEIYNFQSIRTELEALGHRFHSRTDTEVILHAYEQWGIDCLQRFIGMFAFGMWDGKKRELILARDRLGVKPLYYGFVGQNLIFASEIKAILEYPGMPRQVNEEAFYHYLSFHCVPAPATMFAGIFKVEAGHYLIIRDPAGITNIAYWNMFRNRDERSLARSAEEISQEINELFYDATRLRMISDVPFGAFLSGGIDSSQNVAVMSQILSQPVNTFSIGFEEAPAFDELFWARQVAQQFKTNHHEIILTPEKAISFFDEMVFYQDEPIADPVCVPIYFLSKLAKDNGVTVCQVGEGSDELFCGYPTWLAILKDYQERGSLISKWKKLPKLLASYLGAHLFDRGWATYDYCAAFFNGGDLFWGGAPGYRDGQKAALLSPRILANSKEPTSELISTYKGQFKEACYAPDDLTWMSYLDLRLRLPELLLMRLDKMNMAVSLEGRVPYLDHRLVELAMSVSQQQKINGGETKYILKKSIGDILPPQIINRAKQGLGLPVAPWYKKHLKKRFQTMLRDFSEHTDFFNNKFLNKFLSGTDVPWIIINFIAWHNMWIRREVSVDDVGQIN
jgi:asparagine synthase (glutamine-hydrolysing)